MPDRVAGFRKRRVQNIGLDPSDGIRPRAEASAGYGECGGREIEDREIVVARVQQAIDQRRGTPTDVDNGAAGGRAEALNQVQRTLRVDLIPADLRRELGAVDVLPVR